MPINRIPCWRALSFSLAVLMLEAHGLRAQGTAASQTRASSAGKTAAELSTYSVATMVALVDQSHDAMPYRILRNPGGQVGDVILLDERRATGRDLARAVLELSAIRDQQGDTAASSVSVRVRGIHTPSRWDATEIPHAERLLARLRTLPSHNLLTVGSVRSAIVYLPNRARRHENQSMAHP
jgi:hypothetical protein